MSRNGAYSALGGFFEYLNRDCGYEQWSQYLIETLRSLGAGRTGCDIGCGNGYFTRALHKAGYDMKGMDISPEMLSKAVTLAKEQGASIEYLCGDIRKLDIKPRCDFITAINDCINYVPQSELCRAFAGVYKSLKPCGVFIFDISSAEKLKNTLGNNLFADTDENVSYIWQNFLSDSRVDMDITVFYRQSGGVYARLDESQTQYIHEEKDVLKALGSVGFTVETRGHLGGSKEERINFICKKG